MDERNAAGIKIALLSNVNMDFVIRLLQKQAQVYQAQGYGNELGALMNPASAYHAFDPEITFLVMDLMEVLEHDLDRKAAEGRIAGWFDALEAALRPEKIYYVSDGYLWGPELSVLADAGRKAALEHLWQKRLEELLRSKRNVRILPYHHMVEEMGEENTFSAKMWYMGKILLGNGAQKKLCQLILDQVRTETMTVKKVLLLDLDNTLWGGLAGENDHVPVELSEDHVGLAYKNLQRVILQMQRQGVVLGIVSKNNETDAMEILACHPHMVLRPETFAVRRINWRPKHENIMEIAEELNLGLDSFVFWDDSPQERQLVKELLPEVEVPDFPERKEELPSAMAAIYKKYFAKAIVTEEDQARTAQYAANAVRKELREAAGGFEEYLRQLEIRAVRVDPRKHMERLVQLMNKTNQFNLTTRRYTQRQMEELLAEPDKRVYLYSVSDRFGDDGVVAAAVADCTGDVPVLTDFVMSCRVMGKNIEYAIVEDIESDLRESRYERVRGLYVPTAKNKPVEGLYESLGYERIGGIAQCGIAQGAAVQGDVAQGSTAQCGTAQGDVVQGSTTQCDTAQGAAVQGDVVQGSAAQCGTVQGVAVQGDVVQGSTAYDNTALDITAEEGEGVRHEDTAGERSERVYELWLANPPKRMYYVRIEDSGEV